MNVSGIVCEYNPFHNGHKYHIEMTRKQTGCDYIVAVMSGCFTQRGIPAVTDKYTRTRIALENGCDLVIELPVRYATASAEGFAFGAVNTLIASSVVNNLCFGSENGDISSFEKNALILENESEEFKKIITEKQKQGLSYPIAREMALESAGSYNVSITPNDILGTEYVRACLNTGIEPFCIKRAGISGHNENEMLLSENYCSATAIRNELKISDGIITDKIKQFIPDVRMDDLLYPMFTNHFSLVLLSSLIKNRESLNSFVDISDDLAKRINNLLDEYKNWDSFVNLIKTKQYTYSRIQRSLCHCMLNIKKTEKNDTSEKYPIPYIRVLGFRKDSSDLMKKINQTASVPVITKPSGLNVLKRTDSFAYSMFSEDLNAEELYRITRNISYGLNKKNVSKTVIL